MVQNVFVVSVSPYEVTSEETGEIIIGKTCFYLTSDNVHPIKLNCNAVNGLYDSVCKPGVYTAKFSLGANSKGQPKFVVDSMEFVKEFSISKVLS